MEIKHYRESQKNGFNFDRKSGKNATSTTSELSVCGESKEITVPQNSDNSVSANTIIQRKLPELI